MIDFIIVGCGLAGVAFAETAVRHQKTILVFDDRSQNSSHVAAGLYNPVILKRFSGLQDSQIQLDSLHDFYDPLERRLNVKVNYLLPVLRRFTSIEEQNNWFIAADNPLMSNFLSTELQHQPINGISSPFGFGKVLQTGFVDTTTLLNSFKDDLHKKKLQVSSKFPYDELKVYADHVQVGDIKARNIVFAEGFGLHSNPYFNYLPLDGTKGELLTIKAPNLKLTQAVNSSVFILPIGNDLYKVGATYNWSDKTPLPTDHGKQELLEKIQQLLTCDFEIVRHSAGVRPTVKDRKPLLGTHPKLSNLHIMNGLGTRGVMLAPFLASRLFNHIINREPLSREYDIARFSRLYPTPYYNEQTS